MTVNELLKRVDEQKPNAFSVAQKVSWLNDIETQIQEFLGYDGSRWVVYTDSDEDLAKELIVDRPYSNVYIAWIKAKIDFDNEEYESYQNNQAQFSSEFASFKSYALRNGLVSTTIVPNHFKNVW